MKKAIKSKNKEVKLTDTFAQAIQKNPEAGYKLSEMGLFCGGCPMAMMETIEQGAIAHGLDAKNLIKELNKKSRK